LYTPCVLGGALYAVFLIILQLLKKKKWLGLKKGDISTGEIALQNMIVTLITLLSLRVIEKHKFSGLWIEIIKNRSKVVDIINTAKNRRG
jgi:hypothetical protein